MARNRQDVSAVAIYAFPGRSQEGEVREIFSKILADSGVLPSSWGPVDCFAPDFASGARNDK